MKQIRKSMYVTVRYPSSKNYEGLRKFRDMEAGWKKK